MSLEGLKAIDFINILREVDCNRHYTKEHAIYYDVSLRASPSYANDSDYIQSL